MTQADDEGLAAADLSGIDAVRQRVTDHIMRKAEAHDHLDAESLAVHKMYVVGSLGAGQGSHGSDLDLVVVLQYTGETSGHYDWLEYVQHDIEDSLKQNRVELAGPLPPYVGYVDPTLGDQYDCNEFMRQMVSHGEYTHVYDLTEGCQITADHF